MKRLAGCFVFFIVAVGAAAQGTISGSAIFRDTVPLVIQSALFTKISPTKDAFVFLSNRIKVAVARREDYFLTDALIQGTKKTLDSSQLTRIEFRIQSNETTKQDWYTVREDGILLDTILAESSTLILQFRLKGQHKIIQQTNLSHPGWLPKIAAYRYSNQSDSLSSKLTAKAVYENTSLPAGFQDLDGERLIVPAGKSLELAIFNHRFHRDSCLEYRLKDSSTKQFSQWQSTGHLLSLKSLLANHHYSAEIRYQGNSRFVSYQIHVGNYWWQTIWAIAFYSITIIFIARLFVYARKRKRNRILQHAAELGLEKYKTQQNKLDPHWLDNMFHTLLGFIRNRQNELADEYLGKASSILRDKLIHAERLLIPFDDDLKIMRNFISNERLKETFRCEIIIDPILRTDLINVPPILWQPCVENAIKYGRTGGIIEINIFKIGKDLILEIRNAGVLPSVAKQSGYGYGIPITEERIKGWNMANPDGLIEFSLKQAGNEIVASFHFSGWLA